MAGRLEAMNVGEYERARDAATRLGLTGYADRLEEMRIEEDRHERWFGDRVRSHWLLRPVRLIFGWTPPDPI